VPPRGVPRLTPLWATGRADGAGLSERRTRRPRRSPAR
jgi:hypothetical protein